MLMLRSLNTLFFYSLSMMPLCQEPDNSNIPQLRGRQLRVAVRTLVAQRPPHRSVLEELPHTALALGNNAKAN
jgi:hypothetical protein